MKAKTIAIIGGSNKQTYQKVGKKLGCNVLFHNGITSGGSARKTFRPIIKKADCVVVLLGACGHISMDIVKELCKEHNRKFTFHRGFGASGPLSLGLDLLKKAS